jgi:hypothetical protein
VCERWRIWRHTVRVARQVTDDEDRSEQLLEFASQQRARAATDETWRQLKALFDPIDSNLQHAREWLRVQPTH